MAVHGAGVGMADRKRSGKAPQGKRDRQTAEAAGMDQRPLWMIALPSFACTVALASYLFMMIGSRLI
jgi:hypothetical protein